jgi:hypothetical protein
MIKGQRVIFSSLASGICSGRQKRTGLAVAPGRKEQQGVRKTGTLKSVSRQSLVLL